MSDFSIDGVGMLNASNVIMRTVPAATTAQSMWFTQRGIRLRISSLLRTPRSSLAVKFR